jgi:hypothetical protein
MRIPDNTSFITEFRSFCLQHMHVSTKTWGLPDSSGNGKKGGAGCTAPAFNGCIQAQDSHEIQIDPDIG